ncbi:M15 family metallopeptidase [Amycolatopsis nigrescens]|uniref:M15 family metallopeptidase n=1 Tax=Amycolatopsis nigrescens TaxID=381445 RepID=UPI000363D42D|nr:M15 family metallopeptidase [Amycolatopsis nigrescens]
MAFPLAACANEETPPPAPAPPATSAPATTASTTVTTTPPEPPAQPEWRVGARPLPLRPDGYGEVLPTPDVLVNRNLPTGDLLPPPADGRYSAQVQEVPPDVLARSTWQPACPVPAAALRYVTMSFRGFDGRAHTGEMLLNASVAQPVTRVFERLFANGFPIEEMRVTRADELDAAPTGDGNNTGAFVCRPARGQTNWSAHAYGLAIDLNPFCNPYLKGDLVLPELASAYVDRSKVRPGMVRAGDATTGAFAAIGWQWGGSWTNPKDIMHFTANGK